jgi:hypothetical protein
MSLIACWRCDQTTKHMFTCDVCRKACCDLHAYISPMAPITVCLPCHDLQMKETAHG